MLAGACDLIAVKDTVAGTHARRAVQRGARHLDASDALEHDAYAPRAGRRARPDGRGLGRARRRRRSSSGGSSATRPAAAVLLAEQDGDRVVGRVAMSFLRMRVGGEERARADAAPRRDRPGYRGRGIFAALEAANEERAARARAARSLLDLPERRLAAVFLERLGWTTLAARAACGRGRRCRGGVARASSASTASTPRRRASTGSAPSAERPRVADAACLELALRRRRRASTGCSAALDGERLRGPVARGRVRGRRWRSSPTPLGDAAARCSVAAERRRVRRDRARPAGASARALPRAPASCRRREVVPRPRQVAATGPRSPERAPGTSQLGDLDFF